MQRAVSGLHHGDKLTRLAARDVPTLIILSKQLSSQGTHPPPQALLYILALLTQSRVRKPGPRAKSSQCLFL